ncbi:hypothetical protein SGQ44_10740 [Flavobacterium sp. Fl-77]|uniref:Uncharacterized protein n=1 Tax=Flavobacterium flavipigmentatum TaxID=2893884 RepID=A0AAJ2VXH5_9FLAO|nr:MULTISPECIES: hypothetical protein [unclassified Flavobacterium]MDX6182582.1 hypothetical protein [Flavobacterium sp. Fl-33]MDX6186238.1 hypothetical protein [Flavobacterium sp. Fl-77]UFH38385.1 hypothetical protein LNP22_16830 [Flavobacterium sp. F-70]
MSINHNRIKVSDLEKNQPNKILTTNNDGELEFSNISDIQVDSYNALDYTQEGKTLDARQGKILKDLINNINTLLASDNVNLNTIQKLVDAIETVQTSLTTMLVNDLTTGGTTKALTAEMGKTLQTNKVDKVAGERLINATEIAKLSGSINVTTTTKTILSTALTTQNVAGFVTYINTLNPVLVVGSNEIVKYTTSDTGRVFQLNLRGRSFGVGQPAILAANVTEITDFLNKDIRLSNYPSTRNDGPSTTNKVLAPDVNGNLKLYTIATFPAPFLDQLTPENIQPNTTDNIILKGAFFTPTMTISFGSGALVNYIEFKNDNEVVANITTGSVQGSSSVTLNNGLSATYNNVLLITLGELLVPQTNDFNIISGVANISESGEIKISSNQALGIVTFFNVPLGQDFQLRFAAKPSPISTATYTNGEDYVDIVENGISRYRFSWWFGPSRIGAFSISKSPYSDFANNNITTSSATTIFPNLDEFYFERIGSQMYVKKLGITLATFTDLSNTGSITFKVGIKHFNIGNIKYIKR